MREIIKEKCDTMRNRERPAYTQVVEQLKQFFFLFYDNLGFIITVQLKIRVIEKKKKDDFVNHRCRVWKSHRRRDQRTGTAVFNLYGRDIIFDCFADFCNVTKLKYRPRVPFGLPAEYKDEVSCELSLREVKQEGGFNGVFDVEDLLIGSVHVHPALVQSVRRQIVKPTNSVFGREPFESHTSPGQPIHMARKYISFFSVRFSRFVKRTLRRIFRYNGVIFTPPPAAINPRLFNRVFVRSRLKRTVNFVRFVENT